MVVSAHKEELDPRLPKQIAALLTTYNIHDHLGRAVDEARQMLTNSKMMLAIIMICKNKTQCFVHLYWYLKMYSCTHQTKIL